MAIPVGLVLAFVLTTAGAYAAVGSPFDGGGEHELAAACRSDSCGRHEPSTEPAPSAESPRRHLRQSHPPAGVGKSPTPKNTVGSNGTEFAPYVDLLQYPAVDLLAVRSAGIKHLNLAFIVAGDDCTPSWGGSTSLTNASIKSRVAAYRAAGGSVRISFGGESGTELASACSSADELASAYQSVIDAFSVSKLDFDVEGGALSDTEANDRRSRAIAILQRTASSAGKTLDVSVTLPVNPNGLTSGGVSLLNSAASNGATIHAVNVMAMDFGESAAPDPDGKMGYYAIQSMKGTQSQVKSAFGLSSSEAWSRVAVTTLIGVNEPSTEVFTESDARQLTSFARSVGAAWVSMWQIARDQPCDDGNEANATSDSCAGSSDTKYDFAKAFLA
ncbi:chitinase [Cryptosporangium sp. NPDC051539]|uniref:chitinase n=1 Tax=Cryptosporangium sp. NPDC051539 TaxID=3363962 RepID=UPI00379BC0B4